MTSLHKIKESQNEALSVIGIKEIDSSITNTLVELSWFINMAIEKGKKIDIKSDEVYQQIENIGNKIKELTNKIRK